MHSTFLLQQLKFLENSNVRLQARYHCDLVYVINNIQSVRSQQYYASLLSHVGDVLEFVTVSDTPDGRLNSAR